MGIEAGAAGGSGGAWARGARDGAGAVAAGAAEGVGVVVVGVAEGVGAVVAGAAEGFFGAALADGVWAAISEAITQKTRGRSKWCSTNQSRVMQQHEE